MTINEAQETVDRWIKEHGVRYFNELTNMALLIEETGELARVISRTYGEQSYKDFEKMDSVSEELADVLFVLICIANQTGTNLTDAFIETLRKKTERDSSRHKNNPKII
jgi:NTP pyrophosphatase (non-canonical NTP hydrolase)